MAYLHRLVAMTFVAAGILLGANPADASRKATDLMAAALKQRAAGNISEAISSFEYALENTSNPLQKNLARFMLGDCQIEAGRHHDAVGTFNALLEAVSNPEEQAEAIYRLMQAESALGNRNRAESLFARMRRNHRSSPYYELGRAFMKSEGLRMEADEMPSAPVKAASSLPVSRKKSPETSPRPAVAKTTASATPIRKEVVKEPAAAKPEPVKQAPGPTKTVKVRAPAPANTAPGAVSLDIETTRLLRSVLTVDTAEGSMKDDLATRILGLQDRLRDGADRPGMDKTLLELADCTASFGELLEACKTYDQLLTNHPASPLVEKAYYEAIRLRAILGVHEAVIGWAKAFLAAFPTSEYRARVRALVEYSQAGGRVDLGQHEAVTAATKAVAKGHAAGSAISIEAANAALAADSEYVAASNKMKEGRYNLALVDFKRLSGKHAQAPQIWWDLSLVYVQLEDFGNAEKSIKQMIRLDSDNQDANSLLGYIHYRLENYEEAATAYEQAGESEGRGVNFFDAQNASQRMKKTAGKRQAD